MKKFFVSVSCLASMWAVSAHASSDSFGRHDSDGPNLSTSDLRKRFELQGEVYILDASGEHILKKSEEERKWRPSEKTGIIESNWSVESNQFHPLALYHHWEIENDGRIKAMIEQYDRMEAKDRNSPVKKGKLLKREEFFLKDFQPYMWTSVVEKDQKVIVRFTPRILEDKSPQAISDFPIAGSDIVVSDKTGSVWARGVDMNGKYVGVITHHGALFLSYSKFQGAKELGIAKNNEIELDLDDGSEVYLQSQSAFLPKPIRGKVFGVFKKNLKSERLTSVHMIDSNKEDRFLERMKNP